MAVLCPHCGHSLKIKAPKPGKYKPTCNKCSERFSLIIPKNPNAKPAAHTFEEVERIREKRKQKKEQEAREQQTHSDEKKASSKT